MEEITLGSQIRMPFVFELRAQFHSACSIPAPWFKLFAREIAPGREATPDRLICEAFREREVMREVWPANTSSIYPGPGEGGREEYWVDVAVAAANAGIENGRVGEERVLDGMICRRAGLLDVTSESGILGFEVVNVSKRRIQWPLDNVGEDGPEPVSGLPSSARS